MLVLSRCAKPTPTPYSLWKNEPRICHVVLPGAEGIGALAVATAAAMPRRASVRLSPICDCSAVTCDWKPAERLESWAILTATVGRPRGATWVSRRPLPGVPNDPVLESDATAPEPIATELAASA